MDAGAVLNALLARHSAHRTRSAATRATTTTSSSSSINDNATSVATQGPPAKIAEAVVRGVNPLMLNATLHPAEDAARQRAKRKRAREPAAEETPGPSSTKQTRRTTARAASASAAAQSAAGKAATQKSAAGAAAVQRRPPPPVDPTRENAVSRTLAARHQELRAKQREEEESRRRPATPSDSAPSTQKEKLTSTMSATAVGGRAAASTSPPSAPHEKKKKAAATARTRRYIWRRRCTTRKTLRLTRGVSRAAGVRRYWSTTLEAKPSAPAAAAATAGGCEPAKRSAEASSISAVDAAEVRCAGRRRRAARRIVLANLHTGVATPRTASATATAAATAATSSTTEGSSPEAMAEDKVMRKSSAAAPRLTRGAYRASVRKELDGFDAAMWGVAVRVVTERRSILEQLTLSCTAATTTNNTIKNGVLPLLLARHFPLFGARVEVQELELRVRASTSRTTRHRRRARYTGAAAAAHGENHEGREVGYRMPPVSSLRVVQRHVGVIVEDYHTTVGVLLMPPLVPRAEPDAWASAMAEPCVRTLQALQEAAGSPRVVRVPKHFPGASGAFAELLPSLLALSSTGGKKRKRKSMRVLAGVFTGEVAQEGGVSAAGAAYPLKRLLNRCL